MKAREMSQDLCNQQTTCCQDGQEQTESPKYHRQNLRHDYRAERLGQGKWVKMRAIWEQAKEALGSTCCGESGSSQAKSWEGPELKTKTTWLKEQESTATRQPADPRLRPAPS